MDCLHMTISGRVTKVTGWRTVKGNEVFRFGMACNRLKGATQETLYLRVDVPDPLCNIVAERGVMVGEALLVMTGWVELAAVIQGNQARPFLNLQCNQIYFLSNDRLPALEHGEGFTDRSNIIDYNALLRIRSERTG